MIPTVAYEYSNSPEVRVPDQPAADAPEDEKEYYKRWIKADEMSRCYILAAMSGVLQHQHQSMATAADMLFNLKEHFGDQNRVARQVAMKALMNTQMAEGLPVRDHVLKMMSHLNEIEILSAELDGETQIDIIFMSLSKSFEQFRLNYNINKRLYSLVELLTELQAAEGLFRKSVQVNVAEKGSSSKPKGMKKKKKDQTQKAVKAVAVQGGVKKSRESASGASSQGFQLSRMLRDGEIYVFMGDATKVAVVAIGVIHLSFGHINLRRIQRLVADGPLSSLAVEPFPVCESFLEVIDDYSRYGYVYLLCRKSECFEKFKEYKSKTEKRLNKSIKSLRSDRGGEYLLGEFREYLSEKGYNPISGEHDDDLRTYEDALQDKDADLWKKAMESEMESMYSN
ncbi:hypothetical protein AgCh_005337 [Apium graveolens]